MIRPAGMGNQVEKEITVRRTSHASAALCVLALCCSTRATAQDRGRLSSIPRVDVHAHLGEMRK